MDNDFNANIWLSLFVNTFIANTIIPINVSNIGLIFVANNTGIAMLKGLMIIVSSGVLGFYFNFTAAHYCAQATVSILHKHSNANIILHDVHNMMIFCHIYGKIALLGICILGGYFPAFGSIVSTCLGVFAIRSLCAWLGLWLGYMRYWHICWHELNMY